MQHIVRQAAPMTPQILRLLRQNLNLSNPSDATFRALFLITVFTMARKSNLVPDRADLFNPEKQLPKEKILVWDGCLLVFLKWTKNIQIPGPLCVLSLLIVTCVNSLHYKIIRQPFHPFPVLAQFRLCMRSSMVSWNNWSKHAASTQMITQHTASAGWGLMHIPSQGTRSVDSAARWLGIRLLLKILINGSGGEARCFFEVGGGVGSGGGGGELGFAHVL